MEEIPPKVFSEPQVQEDQGKKLDELPYKFPVTLYILMALRTFFYLSEYTYHSLLAIYMSEVLLIPLNKAVSAYHAYKCIALNLVCLSAYFMDSFIGRFRSVAIGGFIFTISMVFVSLPPLMTSGNHTTQHAFLIVGVILSGIGMAIFTASFAPFAIDQLQHSFIGYITVEGFFSLMIFHKAVLDLIVILTIGIILSPIGNLSSCYLNSNCYSFCFIVCSCLSFLGLVTFLCGYKKYKVVKLPFSALLSPCVILYAIHKKVHSKGKKEPHWLDYAKTKYNATFVDYLKLTLEVMAKQLALYWVCYDQRLSSWTMIAVRLNREFLYYELMPEMLIIWHPIFVIILLPIHYYYTYPLMLKTTWLKSYISQMVLGLSLLIISFIFASMMTYFTEYKTNNERVKNASVSLINANSAPLFVGLQNLEPFRVNQNDYKVEEITVDQRLFLYWHWSTDQGNTKKHEMDITISRNVNHLFLIFQIKKGAIQLIKLQELKAQKSHETAFYVVCGDGIEGMNLKIVTKLSSFEEQPCSTKEGIPILLGPGTYSLHIDNEKIIEKKVKYGSIYLFYFYKEDSTYKSKVIVIEEPDQLSMWWTIPQYLALSVSYVIFALACFTYQFIKTPSQFLPLTWAMSNLNIGLENILAASSTGLILSQAFVMLSWTLAIIGILIFYVSTVKKFD